jgi:hypothetical protein
VSALAERYKIPPIESRTGHGPAAISGFWFDLWFAVASEYVSAFRTPRRGGAATKQHRQRGSAWPYAHEARLVQLVQYYRDENRRRGRSHTRPTLFAEIAKHSKEYPWKYKDLKKPSSFEQEWKKISAQVKQNPANYLPPAKLRYRGGLVPLAPDLVTRVRETDLIRPAHRPPCQRFTTTRMILIFGRRIRSRAWRGPRATGSQALLRPRQASGPP